MGSIVNGIGKMCIAEQDEMTSQNNHLIMGVSEEIGGFFLPSLGFFSSLQVFVMTPEILYQNLHHCFMTMESIELLIFDECHHARKHHRYACIMQVRCVFSLYAWLA